MLKLIPNCPGYSATKTGQIWSHKTNRFLFQGLSRGYHTVTLYVGRKITKKVANLILETFTGPRPKGMDCCHNNGVRSDNNSSNLRWDTRSNNIKDTVKHGTNYDASGEKCGTAKLTNKQIKLIRRLYKCDVNQHQLAKRFNISQSNVSRIVNRERWRHI